MAIAYVSASVGVDNGGTAVSSYNIPAFNLAAGNLVYVTLRSADNGNASSITDTAGNTYYEVTSNVPTEYSWYCKNSLPHASNVVTINWPSAIAQYVTGGCVQFSGLDTATPLDATAIGTATGTTLTSGSFTTLYADEVIICGLNGNGGSMGWSAGSGYTLVGVSAAVVLGHQYKIVSAIQSGVTASATSTNSGTGKQITVGTFTTPIPRSSGSPIFFGNTAIA